MRRSTTCALVLLATWLAAALLAGPYAAEARAVVLERTFAPPSAAVVLGADDLGRSVALRLLLGARVSLAVALAVVVASAAVGILVGLLAAWLGGLADLLLCRLIDVFLAFPGLLLAIALAGLLGPGLGNVVIALGLVGWVGFARLARAQALALARREHVLAARALGTAAPRILWRHLLPPMRGPLVVEATFALAAVIVAEAGLSFLGLGVQPPTPSWGSMLRDGTRYLLFAPHLVLAPACALASVVVAINLLGDRLRDHLELIIPGHGPARGTGAQG